MAPPARAHAYAGAVAPALSEHQHPQQDDHHDDQHHHQEQAHPRILEEGLHLVLVIEEILALHRRVRHQVQPAVFRPVIADGQDAQHLARLHGGVHALAE